MRAASTLLAAPARATRVVPRTLLAPPAGPAANRRLLSETDVGARLLRRLDAACAHPTVDAMAALRAAVTDLVDRLKALDLTLERVSAALETLLHEHDAPGRTPVLHVGDPPAGTRGDPTVVSRLRGWCVRAYDDDEWW